MKYLLTIYTEYGTLNAYAVTESQARVLLQLLLTASLVTCVQLDEQTASGLKPMDKKMALEINKQR